MELSRQTKITYICENTNKITYELKQRIGAYLLHADPKHIKDCNQGILIKLNNYSDEVINSVYKMIKNLVEKNKGIININNFAG